jgi:hypothetical protein
VTPSARVERLLLVLTPAMAFAAVALGLRLGASEAVVAAEVRAAPRSGAGTGLAWQIVVFREDHGMREPVGGIELDAFARAAEGAAFWHGTTNEDGVAEALFRLPADGLSMQVRAGDAVLAEGACERQPPDARPDPVGGWLSFARRDGAIALDVAALGTRVAPGFPAELWVHATDGATHAPVSGVAVELASDSSLLAASPGRPVETDSRGWAGLTATPVGLAVVATFHARSRDGRTGEWTGGLYMSPGAVRIETRRRWGASESPEFALVAPTAWANAALEIDDSHGRAWAALPSLAVQPDGTSTATVRAPSLAPGLYWAVGSEDPAGAATLSSGTLVRPFFVAATDDDAFTFGTDRDACRPPSDSRETATALSACLALSSVTPTPRWRALDGFARAHALDRERRAKGRAIALSAILTAMLLEAMLLVRAAAGRTPFAATGSRAERLARVTVAVLVGILGLALLAAVMARASGE